jgi:hypothetical protein
VGISVVLAGAVVPVLGYRCMWRESFKPGFVVMVETAFVKISQIYLIIQWVEKGEGKVSMTMCAQVSCSID